MSQSGQAEEGAGAVRPPEGFWVFENRGNLRRVLRKKECDLFCINMKQFLKLLGREQSVQGYVIKQLSKSM